jgi:YNFM family putative membrane transporter
MTLAGSFGVGRWLPYQKESRQRETEPDFAALQGHLQNPQLLVTFATGFNVLFSLVGIVTCITFYLAAPPFRSSAEKLSYLIYGVSDRTGNHPGSGVSNETRRAASGSNSGDRGFAAGCTADALAFDCYCDRRSGAAVHGASISQASATSHLPEVAPPGERAPAAGLYLSFYYVGGRVAAVVPSYRWAIGKWPTCVGFIAIPQMVTLGIALLGWLTPPRRG